MENSKNADLVKMFQSCCEQYFVEKFRQNRHLYFDKLPYNYFGTDYKVEITMINFDWLIDPILSYDKYLEENNNHGKARSKFEQSCTINYIFKTNSLLESERQIKTVKFYADTLEPFGKHISIALISDDLILTDNLRKLKLGIKIKFQIQNIDETRYENEAIGFGFFTGILRKARTIVPKDNKISHGYFYSEISQCHLEIQECLLNCIFYQQYSSNLFGSKIIDEEFYLPNLNYTDFQYLIAVESGLDRLYSFWDRITFLLANYDSLGLDFRRLSFDTYFQELNKRVRNGNQIIYDAKSKHLSWLIKFHENYFKQITNYRHRIVHYKMTPKWEGTLTSKFLNNSMELGSNPTELKKLKLEFEGLGNLLFEHFNYCKKGFTESLYLIDELQ